MRKEHTSTATAKDLAELERFVERRSQKGERTQDELDPGYIESVRRFHEREHNRREWVRFFDRMATSHARISEDYQRRAEELCEEHDRGEGLR